MDPQDTVAEDSSMLMSIIRGGLAACSQNHADVCADLVAMQSCVQIFLQVDQPSIADCINTDTCHMAALICQDSDYLNGPCL